ncbi:hypothetical protein J3R82DRAFT_2021, partial [Butyriboletus roseoflavus]
ARAPLIHPIQTAVVCDTCNKTIGRKADLARHMKVHSTNKEALYVHRSRIFSRDAMLTVPNRMHACPHRECTSGERPNKCPEDGCDFNTSDPGSLTRHRKEVHAYEPKASSERHTSSVARKAARRQRRISPYTPSSSISPGCSVRSTSPLDPPSGICSPHPRVPAILDPSPPSPPLPANAHQKDGIKNISAAYSTELITKLPRVNDSGPAPNRRPEDSLLTSGLSTALEAPAVGYTQLLVPEQRNFCAVDPPAHPVPAGTTPIEVSDAMLDEFLTQFDNWYPKATPAYTAPPLPAPFGQYPVDNAHAPTPASLPSYGVQYTIDNAIMSTPASYPSYAAQYTAENPTVPTPASHPSYWTQYAANNTSYSYPTNAVSFDPQFSQPNPFTTPHMGFYPHVVDQTSFYTAPAM